MLESPEVKKSKTHKKSYGAWLGRKVRVKGRWLVIHKLLGIKL